MSQRLSIIPKPLRFLCLVGLCTQLLACASVSPPTDAQLERLLQWRPVEASNLSLPSQEDLFRLTPDMEAFIHEHVDSASRYGRLRQLTKALISSEGLALSYDASANGTAAEVFQQRRSNCLSFAILFMAFADYLQLDAYANEVRIPQTWDVHGRNTLVTYRHVNVVAMGSSRRQWVVDLNQGIYSPYYPQRKMNERALLASLYNNMAVEFMLAKQYDAAYAAYLASIDFSPRDEDTWSNLGNLMKRVGEPELALVAYRQALQFAPSSVAVLSNVYELYREQGNDVMAETLATRVKRARERNPYYHYWLALNAYQQQDWRGGLDKVERALALNHEDHRFHFLKAVLLKNMGQSMQSARAIEQAKLLGPAKKASHYSAWLDLLTLDSPAES